MSLWVQAELACGTTHHIGWFSPESVLAMSYEPVPGGWHLVAIYPETVLEDAHGVDGAPLRRMSTTPESYTARILLAGKARPRL